MELDQGEGVPLAVGEERIPQAVLLAGVDGSADDPNHRSGGNAALGNLLEVVECDLGRQCGGDVLEGERAAESGGVDVSAHDGQEVTEASLDRPETSGKLGACIGKCAKLGPLERGVDEDGLGSPVQRVDEAGCKGGARIGAAS